MHRATAVVAALTLLPGLCAAPVPRDVRGRPGPTLVIQTQSINELNAKLRGVIEPFAALMPFPEGAFDLRSMIGEEYFAGIDDGRWFAAYATLSDNILASQVVAMVPVSDRDDFIALLKAHGVGVGESDDVYQLEIPEMGLPVYLRFTDEYAYFSLASAEPLEGKFRLSPESVISKDETAATTMWLRVDRIPEGLKEMALSQLKQLPALMPDSKFIDPKFGKVARLSATVGERWATVFLADTKEVVFRYDLDPKSGSFVIETTVEAKPGSDLAGGFDRDGPTNRFASLGGEDAMMRYLFKLPLFEPEFREIFVTLAELTEGEILAEAPAEVRKIYPVFNAGLVRTLNAGEFDLGLMMHGPNADGHYSLVGGFTYHGSSDLAEVWTDTLKNSPEVPEGLFKFDVARVSGVAVHEVDFGALDPPEDARKGITAAFGGMTGSYAFGKDRVVAAIGADAKQAIARALNVEPIPAPLVLMDQSMKGSLDFAKKFSGEEQAIPPQMEEVFGKYERLASLGVHVQFGDGKMIVRVETGTAAFMAFGMTAAVRVGPGAAPPVQQAVPVPIKD